MNYSTPLYPQEAYSEQNNAQAFAENKNLFPLGFPQQKGQESPLSSLFGNQGSQNPLLPILLKALTGQNSPMGGDNPLFSLLSCVTGKKNPTSKSGTEKQFPD